MVFFPAIKIKKNKHCHYIGRAADIRCRFFDAGGHFHNFIWGNTSNKQVTMKLTENIIKDILKDGKLVEI